jgi:DNA topoisomerase VI subunit B
MQDNGSGMPHKDIPNMLGKVLSGTKYGVKQTRGKFGLGAKMALIWSKMTTGLPFEIWSAQRGQPKSHFRLDIDILKCVLVKPISSARLWASAEPSRAVSARHDKRATPHSGR